MRSDVVWGDVCQVRNKSDVGSRTIVDSIVGTSDEISKVGRNVRVVWHVNIDDHGVNVCHVEDRSVGVRRVVIVGDETTRSGGGEVVSIHWTLVLCQIYNSDIVDERSGGVRTVWSVIKVVVGNRSPMIPQILRHIQLIHGGVVQVRHIARDGVSVIVYSIGGDIVGGVVVCCKVASVLVHFVGGEVSVDGDLGAVGSVGGGELGDVNLIEGEAQRVRPCLSSIC